MEIKEILEQLRVAVKEKITKGDYESIEGANWIADNCYIKIHGDYWNLEVSLTKEGRIGYCVPEFRDAPSEEGKMLYKQVFPNYLRDFIKDRERRLRFFEDKLNDPKVIRSRVETSIDITKREIAYLKEKLKKIEE